MLTTNILLQFINTSIANRWQTGFSLPPSVSMELEAVVISFDHVPEEHRATHQKDHSLHMSNQR